MNEPFKSGFVSILGRPNAGKSTLLNRLLGSKLCIVSPKPQTTRHKILGILNGPGHQICFLDTPGLLEKISDPLQQTLVRAARQAARQDADALILLVEPEIPDARTLEELAPLVKSGPPIILAVNKADRAKPAAVEAALTAWKAALTPAVALGISALKGTDVPRLLQEILNILPEGPAYYEAGRLSDRWERFFAAELVREQVFELFDDEIPHCVAVQIDSFSEKSGRDDQVEATLYAEREQQKAILIGKNGSAIRALQARAQSSLKDFLSRPVKLTLRVKVRKNWRRDPGALKEFGYTDR